MASAPLRAFPGAEGFGTDTPGGRGGKVYVVTTLNWDGPGSFGEALYATGPRIIVFRVSGVIDVPSDKPLLAEENSYLTVAGQTSPGGITFRGGGTTLETYHQNFHDAVFRFLRFRGDGNYDNVSFSDAHHFVFDHCDFSGGEDETLDICYAHDFTVQWSTVTNSGPDGQIYGQLIAYPPTSRITMHHNLTAHHKNRCGPRMHWGEEDATPAEGALFDYRNNVAYNCAFDSVLDITDPGQGTVMINFVGNYAKAGPDTPEYGGAWLSTNSPVYALDNVFEPGDVLWNFWSEPNPVDVPFDHAPVTTQRATEAWDAVLDCVGALPRDAMNTRTIEEARNGTGSLGNVSDPLIVAGPEAPPDRDLDGMPDAWELAHGLDPAAASDSSQDSDGDGYTNVEEYLNELAELLLAQ